MDFFEPSVPTPLTRQPQRFVLLSVPARWRVEADGIEQSF
jgi:hypothetical protein